MKETITVAEMAKRMGVNPASIYAGLESGEIPGKRLGQRWSISRHAFERFIETGSWPSEAVEHIDVAGLMRELQLAMLEGQKRAFEAMIESLRTA